MDSSNTVLGSVKTNIFRNLILINKRPKPFEFYTTPSLWNDSHISKKMLEVHLNEDVDLASRNIQFVDDSANWIIRKFDLMEGKSVCDFGCGPGLYATRFAKTGAEVTGIDLSERSIKYARNNGKNENLEIEYILGNYLNFYTEKRFDLITMIYCDFSVLSPEQRSELLKRFRTFLKPGGSLLLDVSSTELYKSSEEKHDYEYSKEDGFWAPDEYFAFQNIFKYESENLVLHKYTIFEKDKINLSFNWFQCYTPESITELFSCHDFEVTDIFGDVSGTKYDSENQQFAVIAKAKE